MDTEHIVLWISVAFHTVAAIYFFYLSLRAPGPSRESILLAIVAASLITALYDTALAIDQGLYARPDGVTTKWGRWVGSTLSAVLFAFAISKMLLQQKNARYAHIVATLGMVLSVVFICLSTGSGIWIWFGVACFHILIIAYILYRYNYDYFNYNYVCVLVYGTPFVYLVYGLFFLLGNSMLGILNNTGETWSYCTLDWITKILYWIFLLNTVPPIEKITRKSEGPYAEYHAVMVSNLNPFDPASKAV
jgi:bacteriorhodopsin